jgi:hypothetical protein
MTSSRPRSRLTSRCRAASGTCSVSPPGAAHPTRLTRLPGFKAPAGVVLGVALSPDGRQLALMVQSAGGVGLRIYSVATGDSLHWWSTPDELGSDIPGVGENTFSLAWTPDGRDLTFTDTPQTVSGSRQTEDVRQLGAAGSGHDLLADSRVILRLPWSPAPFLCTNALLTPDGGSVVCGTTSQYENSATGTCVRTKLEFVSYSLATGRPTRVLATHIGPCAEQAATALWAAPSARTAIGLLWMARAGTASLQFTDTLGLIVNGRFTPSHPRGSPRAVPPSPVTSPSNRLRPDRAALPGFSFPPFGRVALGGGGRRHRQSRTERKGCAAHACLQ